MRCQRFAVLGMFLTCLLWSPSALAADTSEPPMKQWADLAFGIGVPLLSAALVWVGRRIEAVILEHTKQRELQNVLLRLNDAAMDAVCEVKNTFADNARGADGKLSYDSAAFALKKARDKALENLGEQGVRRIRLVLGVGDEALEKILTQKIERSVAQLK